MKKINYEMLYDNFNHYNTSSQFFIRNIQSVIEFKAKERDHQIQYELFKELINKYVVLTRELEEKLEVITHLSETDPLLNINNRLKLNNELQREIDITRRYGHPLSVIMFDIDHFKKVNDKYGHDNGDNVLITIANLVNGQIRKTDIFARWGGEEFMIVLPNTTLDKGAVLAEKLRKIIEECRIPIVGYITSSFGVYQFARGDDFESMVKNVDIILYKAKKSGRNRVETTK